MIKDRFFPREILSKKEMQVFEMMGDGYSTNQIAELLNRDPKTIECYNARIGKKLKIKGIVKIRYKAIVFRLMGNKK